MVRTGASKDGDFEPSKVPISKVAGQGTRREVMVPQSSLTFIAFVLGPVLAPGHLFWGSPQNTGSRFR